MKYVFFSLERNLIYFNIIFQPLINFCFVIIGETLVQIITSDTKNKRHIAVKDTLNNHCNTILDTTDKSVGLINVVSMDISSNGLY